MIDDHNNSYIHCTFYEIQVSKHIHVDVQVALTTTLTANCRRHDSQYYVVSHQRTTRVSLKISHKVYNYLLHYRFIFGISQYVSVVDQHTPAHMNSVESNVYHVAQLTVILTFSPFLILSDGSVVTGKNFLLFLFNLQVEKLYFKNYLLVLTETLNVINGKERC